MEWEGVTIPGKVMAEQAAQASTQATEDFFKGHLNTCLQVMNHRYSKFRYKLLVLDLEIKYMQASRSNMNK